ncbi:hypothetical protein SAMN03080598_03323 [Algoriphagus boritolerans DSM 17298 = JCM 18970]|uniref:Uncharacterized protein n=1 Tax=Algoriphagus boritolerans DSM 17298 = JCM 18970 TaxID=1120964 RepID=A0A1H5Z477_9BACT|nr:hypothetical protein SAMN03080598_03323 [Algoriphagus boritolerans DSM 17298 = JCM 18970]
MPMRKILTQEDDYSEHSPDKDRDRLCDHKKSNYKHMKLIPFIQRLRLFIEHLSLLSKH